MWLPACPKKYPDDLRGSRAVMTTFSANRPNQLGVYLNAILSNPFTCQDSAVVSFLTIQDRKEFEAFQEASKKATIHDEVSQGAEAWRGILRSLPDSVNATTTIEQTRDHLIPLRLSLLQSLRTALVACTTSATLYNDYQNMQIANEIWSGKESILENDQNTPNPTAIGASALSSSISALCQTCSNLTMTATVLNRIQVTVLFPNLLHQISMVDGAIDMIRKWEADNLLIERTIKTVTELTQHKEEMETAKTTSFMAKFKSLTTTTEKVEEEISAAKEKLAALKRQMNLRERAMTFSEIERFLVQRAQRMGALSTQMLAANSVMLSSGTENVTQVGLKYGIDITAYDGKMRSLFDSNSIVATKPAEASVPDVDDDNGDAE